MSGNTQRTTFRPPWVKDGPNPSPSATVPWRTKVKTDAVTADSDQSNAVHLIHIFVMHFVNAFFFSYTCRE